MSYNKIGMMDIDLKKISKLSLAIIRIRLGNATEEEREMLVAWLDQSEMNRRIYKKIIRGNSIKEHLCLEQQIRAETDYTMLKYSIVRKLSNIQKRKLYIRLWTSVAVIACMCVIGVSLWYKIQQESKEPIQVYTSAEMNAKVKLLLPSGAQVDLCSGREKTLNIGDAMIVDGRLIYEKANDGKMDGKWNKVVTAVGGEYALQLSDGTQIWLNAETELEYPEFFGQKERIVRLTGEAYFEVAKDTVRPFIVETNGLRTRVLGTSFNIQAYPNEAAINTTLLTGQVLVEQVSSGQSVLLKPGLEAIWQKNDGNMKVREVNAENAIAWRYGEFVFNEEDLAVVLRMLERWYEVEFVFDELKNSLHTFSGKMSKDVSVESVLEMITLAGGPAFRKEGSIIHVLN